MRDNIKFKWSLYGILILCLALLITGAFSWYKTSFAVNNSLNSKCLKCHGVKRLPKVLSNGEKMDLYVNPQKFYNSVHGKIGCLFCHKDINVSTHPKPIRIKSKEAYAKKVTTNCLVCHPVNSLSILHKRVVKKGKLTCDKCHTAHQIQSLSAIKNQTQACLKCHGVKRLPKVLKNGEKMDLYVNPAKFAQSDHSKIGCFACHFEIYNTKHPYPKEILSKKAYTKEVVKNCVKCHPYFSIARHKGHRKIVKNKRFVCIDCHNYHTGPKLMVWKRKVNFTEYCMSCHKFNIKKVLPSGEVLSLKVDPQEIKNSVHGRFQCIVCHIDFSKKRHPVYKFKSRKEYNTQLSKWICQRCHTEEKLKQNPAHYALSKTASCIECHGYHGVQPVKGVKALSENRYCLTCHSRDLTMKMKNGEKLSIQVNEHQLLQSVHKDLKCIDCHKEFSKNKHPVRTFASIKEYRKEAINICNQCHKKEVEEFKNSIHGKAYSKGELNAPDCLKCHGYHNVAKITTNNQLEMCAKCHTKELAAFKESIHYKTLSEGNTAAPTCASCHKAHDVKPINMADLNNSCLTCHKDAEKVHNKWLYNPPFTLVSFVKTHFKGASCAVCHASGKKAVVLTLIDQDTGKPFTIKKVAMLLNLTPEVVKEKIDLNKDGLVEEKELWQFMSSIKQVADADLKGRLALVNANDAHKINSKEGAIKNCAACHNVKADFTGELAINREEGKALKLALDRQALNSAYAIPVIRHFYVLALTKISILDILFILAVICGLGFALGHIGLRIITTPIRRKRREGK